LKKHYKEHIFFTEIPGRADVVCFKDMVFFIYEMKKKANQNKENIIRAAGDRQADYRLSYNRNYWNYHFT